jgi:hypothetical protein
MTTCRKVTICCLKRIQCDSNEFRYVTLEKKDEVRYAVSTIMLQCSINENNLLTFQLLG